MLVCFISHKAYSLFCGALLRFLLALTLTRAYYLTVQKHIRRKLLVMRLSAFVTYLIGNTFFGVLLDYLLQYRLVISEQEFTRAQLVKRRYKRQYEISCRFKSAVKIYCRNKCLKCVRQYRVAISAARMFFSFPRKYTCLNLFFLQRDKVHFHTLRLLLSL